MFGESKVDHIQLRIPAARFARVLPGNLRPIDQRAWGMPGAQRTRSRACSVESTRVSHHGHTGDTRHSPRNGFNGFLRALPGDRALLPPSPTKIVFRKLDASVGASGPHDFAVRARAVRHRRIRVHRIPCPTSVTTAKRPSCGHETAGVVGLICPTAEAEYFSRRGWTGVAANSRLICPSGRIRPREAEGSVPSA